MGLSIARGPVFAVPRVSRRDIITAGTRRIRRILLTILINSTIHSAERDPSRNDSPRLARGHGSPSSIRVDCTRCLPFSLLSSVSSQPNLRKPGMAEPRSIGDTVITMAKGYGGSSFDCSLLSDTRFHLREPCCVTRILCATFFCGEMCVLLFRHF